MKPWFQTYTAVLAAALTAWITLVVFQPYLVLFVLNMWAR